MPVEYDDFTYDNHLCLSFTAVAVKSSTIYTGFPFRSCLYFFSLAIAKEHFNQICLSFPGILRLPRCTYSSLTSLINTLFINSVTFDRLISFSVFFYPTIQMVAMPFFIVIK